MSLIKMKAGRRMADRMDHVKLPNGFEINTVLKNSWQQFAAELSFPSHTLSCTFSDAHKHKHTHEH